MDVERILRNTPASLFVTFYTDETPTDADSTVAVTVKGSDGATLSSGNATHVGSAGSGQYRYNLAGQSTLDYLASATWSGTFSGNAGSIVSYLEIVGGFYYTLSELRASDVALADTNKYPTEKLEAARLAVETEFENICNRAFVPRLARDVLSGDGSDRLRLTQFDASKIVRLDVDGVDRTAWATAGDIYRDGLRTLVLLNGETWPIGTGNITVAYEYGLTLVPVDIKGAAFKRSRNRLTAASARIDERATVMQIPDFGTFNLATPGIRGSHTGIPEVDAVLDRWAINVDGVV